MIQYTSLCKTDHPKLLVWLFDRPVEDTSSCKTDLPKLLLWLFDRPVGSPSPVTVESALFQRSDRISHLRHLATCPERADSRPTALADSKSPQASTASPLL